MNQFPHDRRTWMPGYMITVLSISTILLGIRLISRIRGFGGGRPGIDDVFIIFGWLFSLASGTCVLIGTYKYGLDGHIWDLTPSQLPEYVKVSWLIQAFFLISIGFTKLSVLLFYRRVVSITYSRKFKLALWTAMAFVFCNTVIFFALMCSMCKPLEAFWRMYEPTYTVNYTCTPASNQKYGSLVSGALSVFTDWYSVMLPATLLWRMKINKRQKIGLIFIFGTGFLVVGAGITRVIYLGRFIGPDIDKTRLAFNAVVAGAAESCIGVACACAPSLRACFRSYFGDSAPKANESSSLQATGSKALGDEPFDESTSVVNGKTKDFF